MKLTELLAIYTNPEATDEQKQAALAAYEEANKPADTSELEQKLTTALESITKLEGKNQELLTEKQKARQQAEEAARKNMTTEELKADYDNRVKSLKAEFEEKYNGQYAKLLSQLEEVEVNRDAFEFCSDISNNPKALMPHVRSFFGYEVNENGFEKFIKDSEGKRSAMDKSELKAHIESIDYLSPFLKSDFSNKGTTTTRTEGKTENQSPIVQNYLSAMNQ